MTTGQDDEHRLDEPETDTLDSPFRRLTAAGDPAWQRPPQPDPVAEYGPTPATLPPAHELPRDPIHATSPAASGSRFRFMAVLGLVGGIFLLTAVAGGAYIAYQALLGHDDRATAAYAPANSWAYVAVNVDPTSHAWLDAWGLAKEAGIDDELARIPSEGLEQSGEDPDVWETLIKPAVGRELGFAVWPNPEGADAEPYFAAIVMIADEDKARAALDTLVDDEAPAETTYRDVVYQTNDDDSAAGIVDEALILASSSDAFEAIVDARRDGALNESSAFAAAAERAADNPLVFAYVNGVSIADAADSIQSEVMGTSEGVLFPMPDMSDSLDVYRDLGQITLTIKADGNALRTEVLTEGRPATFPMTPAGTVFADRLPASTLFYVASADLYGTIVEPAIDRYEAMFGVTDSDEMSLMPTIDDAEAMLGVDLDGGLLTQLTGPYAISVNVDERNGEYAGQFHFYSEVADGTSAEEAIDELVANLGGMAPIEPIDGGYRVDIAEDDLSGELTVVGDVLHLSGSYGTPDTDGTLADDAAFKAAMESMPSDPTMAGYLAIDRIVDLLPADAWDEASPDMRATLEAFGPLAFATAPDGDGTRTVFVMTVGE